MATALDRGMPPAKDVIDMFVTFVSEAVNAVVVPGARIVPSWTMIAPSSKPFASHVLMNGAQTMLRVRWIVMATK